MIQVFYDQAALCCRVPYAQRMLLREVPSRRWNPRTKCWMFTASPAVTQRLYDTLEQSGLAWQFTDEDDETFFHECLAMMARINGAQEVKDDDDLPQPESKTRAWEHQKKAFHFAARLPGVMLAMEMGTGKSKVLVDLCHARAHQRVLILCPKTVIPVWPREFRRHCATSFTVLPLNKGTTDQRARLFDEKLLLAQARGEPIAVVVNHEAAWRGKLGKRFMDIEWDAVAIDESHRAKDPKGKFSDWLTKMHHRAKHRYCLTGTPMPHSPLDIFAQYRFLDPGIFGSTFAPFKAEYAEMGGFQPPPRFPESHPYLDERGERVRLVVKSGEVIRDRSTSPLWLPPRREGNNLCQRRNHSVRPIVLREGAKQVVGYKNQDRLQEKIFSIAYRCTKEEALDLPEQLWETEELELPPAVMKTYREVEKKFYAEVESGAITAANALTRTTRLRQLMSGFVTPDADEDDWQQTVHLSDHKRDRLQDILSDTDRPAVVFVVYRHDLEQVRQVCAELGKRFGEISGARKDLTDEGHMPDDIDVMGCMIQSGGVGIDLTRATLGIYYSVDFNWGNFDQSISRLHRPGQNNKVHFVRFVTKSTLEPLVHKVLAERGDLVTAIMTRRPDEPDPEIQEVAADVPPPRVATRAGCIADAGRPDDQGVPADGTAVGDGVVPAGAG